MHHHDYIIVGAGPAGLQMGYFLGRARRDYLILEANATAGSFFATQPRHRTLLSLNKRFNWFPEDDFNMRHDWNSLLTDDHALLFRDYSEQLYPSADDLQRYIADFAEKCALRVQYNTRVTLIERGSDGSSNFVLTDATGAQYSCKRLLMATGAVAPYIPDDIEGIELAYGYEDHELDPSLYENKRVTIIGRGNSAFEVANHLAGHAAVIHFSLGGKLVKHAWQTHYVGDLRAINNTVLDMYQLKSLHATIGQKITKIAKQDDGTFIVHWEMDLPHWTPPGTVKGTRIYDHVIRCTGWQYVNTIPFALDITPVADVKGKYPVLSSCWESSVPDLFYIGTVMGGRDRKAASGFIHGFRYNIRTLFHLLEERYNNVPLPVREFKLSDLDDLNRLAEFLMHRISTTSALYQLYGVMCDVLVLSPGKVKFFEELPLDYVLERADFNDDTEMITITLDFGFDKFPPGTNTLDFIDLSNGPECAAFVHAIFCHYSNGEPVAEVNLDETLWVRYDPPAFDAEEGPRKPAQSKQMVMQFINRVAQVTTAEALTPEETDAMHKRRFFPWAPDDPRIGQDHGYPVCQVAPMGNIPPTLEVSGDD